MIEVLERRIKLECLEVAGPKLELRTIVKREVIERGVAGIDVLERRIKLECLEVAAPKLELRTSVKREVIERGVAGPQGRDGIQGLQGRPSPHDYEEFIATDSQVLYQLTRVPVGLAAVFINGLLQPQAEYALVADQVTFISGDGIVAGDRIGVFYFY